MVLTEIPGPARAGPADSATGSAAATATVAPKRRSGDEMRMWTALRRHGRRYIPCAAGIGNARAPSGSQQGGDPARMRSATGQVTRSPSRVAAGRAARQRPAPRVTFRSAEKPPQVPSASLARIRTRCVTPASRPA
ncbi:hypothetical protein GCM10010424_50670 [Streptomyces lienomycini]